MKTRLINDNFYDDYIANLLRARGVEDVEGYLHPTAAYLQAPNDLKNIGMASVLYKRLAGKENAEILIIVDADVDGFTSAAIMYQYTHKFNESAHITYLLHEHKQHGLSDLIHWILNDKTQYDLLIIPDAASNDKEYIDELNDIQLPCLILDHHEVDVKLSDNAVVVNNQMSPLYRNKQLTGAGVAWQFCRFVDAQCDTDYASDLIDLAALGICADMGLVTDLENRYIIYSGFNHVNNKLFCAALEKQAYSITGQMGANWSTIVEKTNPISVAFYIVPMFNALIRVGTMEEKELLFTAFIDGGRQIPSKKRGAKGTLDSAANEAVRICTNARTHQNKILDDTMLAVDAKIAKFGLAEHKVLLFELNEEELPQEINGLLAMKIAAKYKKPTLVLRRNSEDMLRGSLRGLNQSALTDFKSFLTQSGYFEYVQGHANAAGASVPAKNVEAFLEYADKELANIDFGENYYDVNFEREASEYDLAQLVNSIGHAQGAWGQGNDEPIIHVYNIHLSEDNIRIMGSNADTLKIEYNGVSFIKFKAGDLIQEINGNPNLTLEIIGKANLNEYCGRITPQIFISDYDTTATNILDF